MNKIMNLWAMFRAGLTIRKLLLKRQPLTILVINEIEDFRRRSVIVRMITNVH